ncbi:hypothetical protein Hanom_Chr08g00713151 [Helianthus anomalus]
MTAGSPSNLAGMIQSSAKSFIPVAPPQNQTYINGGFSSHYGTSTSMSLYFFRHPAFLVLVVESERQGK